VENGVRDGQEAGDGLVESVVLAGWQAVDKVWIGKEQPPPPLRGRPTLRDALRSAFSGPTVRDGALRDDAHARSC
jgi:hypothetical protein